HSAYLLILSTITHQPPITTLFPYPTLFRSRLHGPVSALRPARGFIGVNPRGVEAITPENVRRGEELAGVVGRDQAEGGVRAAVDEDVVVDGLDPSVAGGAELRAEPHGVPAAMGVEDLLAGVEDLDRP